jgi:hypothetical protein
MTYDTSGARLETALELARERLLDEHLAAGARGEAMLEFKEPYRPLSDAVKAKILAKMQGTFPRGGDPAPDVTASFSSRFRQVVADTLRPASVGRPSGRGAPPEPTVAHNRPDVLDGGPRPGDPSPVRFHPHSGEEAPSWWPPDIPEKNKPHPIELPGALWPDGGQSPTFPVDRALADLARVRWAPARETIWLPTADSPEPE